MFEVPIVIVNRNNSVYICHKNNRNQCLIIRDGRVINFNTTLDDFDLEQFNEEDRKIYSVLLMEALCLRN